MAHSPPTGSFYVEFHIVQIEVFRESEDSLAPQDEEPARFHGNSTNTFNIFLSYSSDEIDEANKNFGDGQANDGKILSTAEKETAMHRVSLGKPSIFASLLFLALQLPAMAATKFVDTYYDYPGWSACTSNPNDCSLRGALSTAIPSDIIYLPAAGTYYVDSPLVIDKSITVSGLNQDFVMLQPSPGVNDRVIEIASGVNARLRFMTIQNGRGYYENGGCIFNEGDLTLQYVTINGCSILGSYVGGGIFSDGGSLTLQNAIVSNNEGFGGGGIFSRNSVNIRGSRIESNRASGTLAGGGGIRIDSSSITESLIEYSVIKDNQANSNGGGIYMSGARVTVNCCEVSNNTASGNGGGIYTYECYPQIINSTISGNAAGTSGGGVYLKDTIKSTTHLSFCSIISNTADLDADLTGEGGGVAFEFSGSNFGVTLKANAIAGNIDASAGANNYPDGAYLGSFGEIKSEGYNFIGVNDGWSTPFPAGSPNVNKDFVGTSDSPLSPKLDLLADNGGGTKTHALLPGSPLANRLPKPCTDARGNSVATDQRGAPRPVGARADVGAFESDYPGQNPAPILLLMDD